MVASMAVGMCASMLDEAALGARDARTPFRRKTLEQLLHKWAYDGAALSSRNDFVLHAGQTSDSLVAGEADALASFGGLSESASACAKSACTWLEGNQAPSQ